MRLVGAFGDPPGKLPLYHLDEVGKADVVYITEGEKCADLVRGLGLIATTSAHGAKSAAETDWTPLAGKTLGFLPDNDSPGEKYLNDVAKIVGKLNPKPLLKVIRLPLKNDGDDIQQWLEQVAPDSWTEVECRTELERLLAEAPAWEPAASRTTVGSNGPPTTPSTAIGSDDKPEIEITTQRHIVVDEATKALARDPDLYSRGGRLGDVISEPSPTAKLAGNVELDNAQGCCRFRPFSESIFGCCLTKNAKFYVSRLDKSQEPFAHRPIHRTG